MEGVQEAKLNGTLLTTALVECHTGSFLQISLTWQHNAFIMDDVHMAFSQRLHLVHLPLKIAPDSERKITVYVANGRTCYTSSTFTCTVTSKDWQAELIATGRRALPKWSEADCQYFPVHVSFEEHATLHDPQLRHFVIADPSLTSYKHRVVIVTVDTPVYSWAGACTWPVLTAQWELLDFAGRGKQWDVYHNCLPIPANSDRNVHIQNGDYFALFERLEKGSLPERGSVPSSASSYQVSPFGNPPGLMRVDQLPADPLTYLDGGED